MTDRQLPGSVVGVRKRRSSAESIAQIGIMLVIGLAAGAASFTHVHNVAAAHGQGGWLAWADAVVLELMSIASGLELRRRHRSGQPAAFPVSVMVTAVLLSISAQVVEAEQSPIGWIAAALPALGFLVMVKIALGHIQDSAGAVMPSAVVRSTEEPSAASRRNPDASPEQVAPPEQLDGRRNRGPAPRAPGRDLAADPVTTDLLPAARVAAAALRADGRRLSRSALADVMRRQGHAASNARVSALLRAVKDEVGGQPLPVRSP